MAGSFLACKFCSAALSAALFAGLNQPLRRDPHGAAEPRSLIAGLSAHAHNLKFLNLIPQ